MWHTWICLDFVVDVLVLKVFPSFFEDVFGEELVVFWLSSGLAAVRVDEGQAYLTYPHRPCSLASQSPSYLHG